MEWLKSTYENKKVFLTGHTGFKGAWLVYWLNQLGAEVKAYALEAENPSLYKSINGDQLCNSIVGDIQDAARVKKEIQDFQPDFIFHLAAQSLVRESYTQAIYTFSANAMGTAHVLDALRYVDGKCTAVLITTDKVYENKEWIYPYKEEDRLGGYDPYSASKACAEIIINSYRNSFFNIVRYDMHQKAIGTARAGNVIGGGDWAKDRLIPDIVRSVSNNEAVIIRNPEATRPWQHVLEPLCGYLLLGAKLHSNPEEFSGAWNFGPDIKDNLSVKELVDKSIQIWGQGSYQIIPHEGIMHEANLLRLDISKATIQLGWKPQFSADQALELSLNWYKNYLKNPLTARELILEDIQAFAKYELAKTF